MNEKKLLRNIEKCSLHVDYLKIRCVCEHIDRRNFGNIIILEGGDVLCQECYSRIEELDSKNLKMLCSKCVCEIIKQFENYLVLKNQPIEKYIIGKEHLDPEKGSIDPSILIDQIHKKPIDHGIWERKDEKCKTN